MDRILIAVEQGETVAVYGDYDVDGITSTCLLTDYLRSKGVRCIPYIPNRDEEGYGLNCGAIDQLGQQGVTLIITVDCGITAVEEAAYATRCGIDMIITDHHECKDGEIPVACAVVDCKQPGDSYPDAGLAGVGVAFKLVCAVEGDPEPILDRYVDLAAVGTVADVMPLIGENRFLVKTGIETELGKIADSLIATEDEKSPLTIRVEKFSKQISVLVVSVAIIVAILLIAKHTPGHEILLTVIAFAVSAMPEGLPLALTMALTIAANKMAKKNVIVRKLNAAESLGSCTVIASDKTGTLTVNQQTAKCILLPNGEEYRITGTGYDKKGKVYGNVIKYAEEIALYCALNNEANISGETPIGDSVDIAFLVMAAKLNVKTDGIKIIERIPYESENKYSAVFYEKNGKTYCSVKGSLEVVQKFCDKVNFASGKSVAKLKQQNEYLAKDGYRVIAVANGEVKKSKKYTVDSIKDLVFMGLVGFIDPIREEAVVSIRE